MIPINQHSNQWEELRVLLICIFMVMINLKMLIINEINSFNHSGWASVMKIPILRWSIIALKRPLFPAERLWTFFDFNPTTLFFKSNFAIFC